MWGGGLGSDQQLAGEPVSQPFACEEQPAGGGERGKRAGCVSPSGEGGSGSDAVV